MQRGIEQADRDGKAVHRREDLGEVGLLHRQELRERPRPAGIVRCEDHLAHHGQPLACHEHVLGAAEADALRAQLARAPGILRRVGVRPHAEPAPRVGPAPNLGERVSELGRDQGQGAEDDVARATVERDLVARAHGHVAQHERPGDLVDPSPLDAGDAGLAHPPRDDCGVRRHAAVGRQHALCVDHPVDVVRRRLVAHEHDGLARRAPARRVVGAEARGADRGARRGRQTMPDHGALRVGVEPRVQELVELRRIDPPDRLGLVDHALVHELARDPHGRLRGPFARAGLQDVELASLDRELDVLHVTVVSLEQRDDAHELVERLGQHGLHPRDRLGRADAGDDILALGVAQELAVEHGLAGRGIA